MMMIMIGDDDEKGDYYTDDRSLIFESMAISGDKQNNNSDSIDSDYDWFCGCIIIQMIIKYRDCDDDNLVPGNLSEASIVQKK